MVSDARLRAMLDLASSTESDIRVHLAESRDSAAEQARGMAAYRNVVGLRKALQDWTATRAYRAQQQSA
jgi:hypothetical protein